MSAVVVSDTGPPHYLVLCGAIQVLPRFFDRVIIPAAVLAEMQHANTPPAVRNWAFALPKWAEVRSTAAAGFEVKLGRGETEAIALALEMKAQGVLVDDDKARKFATRKGLVTLGTLTILEKAAGQNLLDLPTVLDTLRQTNFRIHPRLLAEALARHEQRLHSPRIDLSQTPRRNPGLKP